MTTAGVYLDLITIMDTGMGMGMDTGMGMGMGMGMDTGMGITPIQTTLERKSALACFQDFAKNLNSL